MRNFTSDVASYGESVSLPSFPGLTAVDVTSSTGTFSYDNTSITKQTVVIDQMKATAYSVPEYIFLQSKIDAKMAFAREAGASVADSIDQELVELIASFSTNSVGTAGSDLTEAWCLDALQKLAENYVPLNDPSQLVWVLPATQFGPVHGLKDYGSYQINSGSSNAEGSADVRANVDTLYGIDVVWRNDTAMTVSTGKIGALLHRDSIGVAIQRAPAMREPMPIPGSINTEMLCHALFGIDIIKETSGVLLLCN